MRSVAMDVYSCNLMKSERWSSLSGVLVNSGRPWSSPVTVMETAGEGGAWGMAILASFGRDNHNLCLTEYLNSYVFGETGTLTEVPDEEGCLGFGQFMERFREGLSIERAAVKYLRA